MEIPSVRSCNCDIKCTDCDTCKKIKLEKLNRENVDQQQAHNDEKDRAYREDSI